MAYGKGTLNKAMIIGRLGKDPELKYTPSNTAVANMSVATTMAWKDQSGEQQEKTEWHRIVVWRKQAEFVGEYLKKGAKVYVEGRIETRSWDDQDGVKRYMTEIIAEKLETLGSKGDSGEGTTQQSQEDQSNEYADNFKGDSNVPEDDLPF